MPATRKLAAILAVDIVGFSRLASQDEERILARIRALKGDLIEPAVAAHHGRVVKGLGDGVLVEFRSSVDAVRCALEIQDSMLERNLGLPEEKWIVLRVGIHVGDVVEEADGDLMGDAVNIAVRLEGLCAPGSIVVSEDLYRQIKGKLNGTFSELGPQALKNIPEPIRAFGLRPGSAKESGTRSAPRLPEKPSIAVLPFQNLSGDPEQEYFADGIVEDVITGLSRIKWLFVIARNSSFTYKGKLIDVRKVGQELGVQYVLEGGVRRSGERLRITTQLCDTATGAHIWADRFESAVQDVFDLQDQITERVVAVVEPSVQRHEIERARRKRPESLDAYDLFLRAVPFTASQSAEEGRIAIGYLERALEIEPDYAAAHALAAWCYEWCYSRAGFDPANKEAALNHARAALAGSTDDAGALAVAGWVVTMLSADHSAGLGAIERALAANPSCATALYLAAAANAFSGRPVQAREYATRALRLSPFDLLVSVGRTAQGIAAVQEGAYEEAAGFHALSVEANSTLSSFRFFAACAHALAGQVEAAKSFVQQGLKMEPSFRLRFFYEILPKDIADQFAIGGRLLGLRD